MADQQPNAKGWWKIISAFTAFIFAVTYRYYGPIRHLTYEYISHKYPELVTLAIILLIFSPIFYFRKLLKGYFLYALIGLVLVTVVFIFFGKSHPATEIEREFNSQAVGNHFKDLAISLLDQMHRFYGFFGNSGTAKTNIAEKFVDIYSTFLGNIANIKTFMLHNQPSKSVEDFFDPTKEGSLASWLQKGCGREKCIVILEDLHLLMDEYYIKQKKPSKVEYFFNKLRSFVDNNPRVIVIMVVELSAFGQAVGNPSLANVTSVQGLQAAFKQQNNVFYRLGQSYLPVFFKDVRGDYNEWKAAMLIHLNELGVSAVRAFAHQLPPFAKDTKVRFDESVFKKTLKLVYAFKDVKKYILPRIYTKIVDANTPRDCTLSSGRILTVFLEDDFSVKCEPCGFACRVTHFDAWTKFHQRLSLVPDEFYFRAMEAARLLYSSL